jgi:DNA-binding CsgD family transcriptional regulator
VFIGRDSELTHIGELLTAAREGASGGALIVRGEAGIGKTALLEEAVRSAGNDFLTLRAAGVESEAELPYAGLHQLLRPLMRAADGLPAPQARALRSAFGMESEGPADRMLVGLAALTLLSEATDERPVLCLIDDAQWLDTSSVDAVGFAIRRLSTERVVALLAVRDDTGAVSTTVPAREVRLEPLTQEQSRVLLGQRYRERLTAQVAESVLRDAGGNPLALLELAAGAAVDGAELPTVEQMYVDRIAALEPATRTLLVIAACDDEARVDVLAHAARSLDTTLDALEPAEVDGLVAVAEERIRFRHPLVRSAAYKGATFAQRRRAHLALADSLNAPDDADRRAWHRAAAAVAPDEVAAAELEDTAVRASARSGYAAAAAALERAAQLSSSPTDRARRLVDAAEAAHLGGQRERALSLLAAAEVPRGDVPLQVKGARVRGVVEAQSGSPARAMRILLDAATAIHPLDHRIALELVTLAQESAGLAGALEEVVEFGQWGERLEAGQSPDEQIMLGLVRGFASLTGGDAANAAQPLGRAAALGAATDEPRLLVWAASASMFLGEDQRVFELLTRAVSEARAQGEISMLPFALHLLAGVERRLGNIPAAEADAEESLRLARETGQVTVAAGALSTLTALAAFGGDVQRAEEFAHEARSLATPRGLAVALAGVARAMADLDLAYGRPDGALERLLPMFGQRDRRLMNTPYVLFTTPIYVEAAVRAGVKETALDQLATFEKWTTEGNLTWARPVVARLRALVAADEAEAERCYLEALELHRAYPQPFEHARTSLLFGEMLRRGRRKSDARRHLREALETFDGLDARAWADRAAVELRATGATARKRDASTRGDLTPQELQIVRLVAEGKTNPEVAAHLFLSPKTVQYHLRKVFVKLEISARSELVRLVAEGEIAGAAEAA